MSHDWLTSPEDDEFLTRLRTLEQPPERVRRRLQARLRPARRVSLAVLRAASMTLVLIGCGGVWHNRPAPPSPATMARVGAEVARLEASEQAEERMAVLADATELALADDPSP